jgi:uncharacterized damage-inducible protein DinB
MPEAIIQAFSGEFARYRSYVEKATAHLSLVQMQQSLDVETNSIAIIMKHLGSNLRSRWTNVWTEDGEKPWRDRDEEFVDRFTSKDEVMQTWHAGFAALEATLSSMRDEDLTRIVKIRHEPHTMAMALTRSVSHVAYHSGQIVQLARVIASREGLTWETITVKRGGSRELNEEMRRRAEKHPQ